MAVEITVPRLGWTMEEGIFTQWLKSDGDHVEEGESLYELESDKATQEVEGFDTGILRIAPDAPDPGGTVKVGQVLGCVTKDGEPPTWETDASEAPTPPATTAAPAVTSATPSTTPAVRRLAHELGVELTAVAATGKGGRISIDDVRAAATAPEPTPQIAPTANKGETVLISPRAARVASELAIDPTILTGTGKGGRIRECDVRNAADFAPASSSSSASRIPISATRRTIARRMVAGVTEAAPVTLSAKLDATNLVTARETMKSEGKQAPSPTAMFIHLACLAIERHPILNAEWQNDAIVIHGDVHMSVAVDTDNGLLVPVIRQANTKSIAQIDQELRSLAATAREGKLKLDNMQGGTFTVSNLGLYPVDAFSPILNLPQCAILGIGRINREPAVVNDTIVPRHMVTVSLTIDHRVIDGADGGRFLESLCQCLEQPSAFSQ
jgi:pyruvate dehydrogenase E2 component (dihydrolipoamide acetyltransferase)